MKVFVWAVMAGLAAQSVFASSPQERRRQIGHHYQHHAERQISTGSDTSAPCPMGVNTQNSSQPLRNSSSVASTTPVRQTVTITVTVWPSKSPVPSASETSSSLASTIMSDSSTISDALPAVPTMPSNNTQCPTNMTAKLTEPIFGLNAVNVIPRAVSPPRYYKQTDDWRNAFGTIKTYFPHVNAVRLYATSDVNSTEPSFYHPHLQFALPAAQDHNLKILVGVWSQGVGENGYTSRFDQELKALEAAIVAHSKDSCDRIAAVSVGNEDVYTLDKNGRDQNKTETEMNNMKAALVDQIVSQMESTRDVLRRHGCCNVPVTHTDTWNEWANTTVPWIQKLMLNCDEAIIANIVSYWDLNAFDETFNSFQFQVNSTTTAAQKYGKHLWLGEMGWPTIDNAHWNSHGTNQSVAQQFFDQFGCQILQGHGTAFYYVDWDQEVINGTCPSDTPCPAPAFGLFSYDGKPLLDLSCANFKPDARLPASNPPWWGGTGE